MVLIAGAIPALGAFAGKTIIDSREGRLVARTGRAADVVLPPTPAQVIVGLDAEGQAETIALASLRPGGRGGFFILMPTLLRVEVPGIGPAPLASAFATGGTTLLRQTVETALDIRVEQVSVLDPASWPTVVTGPIEVSFDDPVAIPGVDGRLEELFPPGPSSSDRRRRPCGARRWHSRGDRGGPARALRGAVARHPRVDREHHSATADIAAHDVIERGSGDRATSAADRSAPRGARRGRLRGARPPRARARWRTRSRIDPTKGRCTFSWPRRCPARCRRPRTVRGSASSTRSATPMRCSRQRTSCCCSAPTS